MNLLLQITLLGFKKFFKLGSCMMFVIKVLTLPGAGRIQGVGSSQYMHPASYPLADTLFQFICCEEI